MMEQDMTVAPGRTHKYYYTGKPRVEFGAGLSYGKWGVGLKPGSAPTVSIDSAYRPCEIPGAVPGHLADKVQGHNLDTRLDVRSPEHLETGYSKSSLVRNLG